MTELARIALVGIVGAATLSGPSRAAHAESDVFLDDSIGRLDPGETRIGLWSVDHGLSGRAHAIQIGTSTLPYLSALVGVTTGNAVVKLEPWRRGPWRSSIEVGVTYLRFRDSGARVDAFIVPVRALVGFTGWRRWVLVGGLAANVTSTTATLDTESQLADGAFIGSNVQLPIGVELRVTSWFHLALRYTYVIYQNLSASASAKIDDKTTADAYVVHRIGNPFATGYTSFDMLFGGHRVGFRLGLSYGDVEVPFLHVIVPTALPLPRGDLYVRF